MGAIATSLLQAEVAGLRHTNRSLTQRLLEFETLSGGRCGPEGTRPDRKPSPAELEVALSELEGLRQTCRQLEAVAREAGERVAAAEAASAALAEERSALLARALDAEQHARDAASAVRAQAAAADDAAAAVAGAQRMASRVAAGAAAEGAAAQQDTAALAAQLLDARRKLADTTSSLEKEVGIAFGGGLWGACLYGVFSWGGLPVGVYGVL
jgi:hypothetical protein